MTTMLAAIHKRAAGIAHDVRSLSALSSEALLERAIVVGPPGGCHEAFSPLYVYNVCHANCAYCGFRKGNVMTRVMLSERDLGREAGAIWLMGCTAAYVLGGTLTRWDTLSTLRGTLSRQAEFAARGLTAVREQGLRPILEMSPFARHELEHLAHVAGPGCRYVLFQEAYGTDCYRVMHTEDDMRFKGTPEERATQPTTALTAGWRQVGVGALLGANPDIWFEVACVTAHARILLDLGAELVTISVPRLNPAKGATTDARCTDDDFIRAVAITSIMGRAYAPGRIKVVITGRETPEMRDHLAPLTDIWGIRGSTTPGGYAVRPDAEGAQFSLVDRRTLAEITSAHAARYSV
ncbi:hypothetical protein HYS28_02800 [Candidatus Uhrbacteria bacterium]|nr:hypothetical protein [Candidatus Uhrbacteria bacterium]